ncbi:hypothetical protein CDAR_482391 [Caerostris darwini]|uniref:Uncharacterized protein n=1 Tax=Caerostris darwini TaxID=1538125 RepID=A0AAV4TKQ2_9ARAC|nr:hypothetical protein CDAR_482391 [Caerostris darwini]
MVTSTSQVLFLTPPTDPVTKSAQYLTCGFQNAASNRFNGPNPPTARGSPSPFPEFFLQMVGRALGVPNFVGDRLPPIRSLLSLSESPNSSHLDCLIICFLSERSISYCLPDKLGNDRFDELTTTASTSLQRLLISSRGHAVTLQLGSPMDW